MSSTIVNVTQPKDAYQLARDGGPVNPDTGLQDPPPFTGTRSQWMTSQASVLVAGVFVNELTTTRTLTEADNGKIIVCTAAGAVSIFLNNGLPAYFSFTILQKGTGVVTIVGSATRETLSGFLPKTSGRHSQISASNYGVTDTYHVGGQLGS